MITITNLSKNFDQRMLLSNVSLSIYSNEKIGLTGPNGAGKTTLFSLILGKLPPGAGDIQLQKNLNIGYLPQEARFDSQRTVLEELTGGDSRIQALKKEKRELEDKEKADSMRYGDVLHELEVLGIYELEHKAEKVLSGLGFQEEDVRRPVVQLSGGWQMRTLLAKLLTYNYDLLLLDEPTNYLDLAATLWLKGFLSNYPGTFVIISHDKVFLNDITNYTIILEEGQLTKVKGNYAAYEESKAVRFKTLEKQQKVVDKKRQQLERFTQRFHAQPNRASAVRNKRRMIERLENESVELPTERPSIQDFEVPVTRASGYVVARLENAAKAYGDKVVYKDLSFELTRGQKICLVGPNGAGKSTLLKMLARVIEPDAGELKLGHNVDLGYFSQTRLDVLTPHNTVFEEVTAAAPGGVPAVKVRTLLGLFNFHGDDVFKSIQVLSGGEKSRVILAKLLINPPNFILLDEPTTHLDIDGVEALTRAFQEYEGSLCFISHDLYFVGQIANQIAEVDGGRLRMFPGGLEYYLGKKEEREEGLKQQQKEEKQNKKARRKEKNDQANPLLDELHLQHKQALKRISEIKEEIKELEKEKKDLETENYVKARIASDPFSRRDEETLKEYGQRLKFIQKRSREIDMIIGRLIQEKDGIHK
jgi:ATP-binding cassette subfamily F protein 3